MEMDLNFTTNVRLLCTNVMNEDRPEQPNKDIVLWLKKKNMNGIILVEKKFIHNNGFEKVCFFY